MDECIQATIQIGIILFMGFLAWWAFYEANINKINKSDEQESR